MGLLIFSERRIKVLIKYSSNISSVHAFFRLCGRWEKGRWLLTQKYFSIKDFRQMLQLAIDNTKFTELARSTIKNAFSEVILPRLKVWVFLFLIFHCYVPFQISEVFHGFLK